MNNAVTGWRAFSNPRYFPEPYRRQKGWERIRNDNEPDNSMDGFQEIPTEEMEQLGPVSYTHLKSNRQKVKGEKIA